ncbi:MAG: hypothetical protein ACKODA_04770 [Nevskiaceae bacterium]
MSLATSLYDALTRINIPNDQAREVVESLEQKMTADFASKADVATIRADIATVRTEIALVLGRLEQHDHHPDHGHEHEHAHEHGHDHEHAHEVATEAEFAALRRETKTEFAAVRGEMKAEFATLRSEMKALTFDITTRMGLLYVTATSFLLAMLKFT